MHIEGSPHGRGWLAMLPSAMEGSPQGIWSWRILEGSPHVPEGRATRKYRVRHMDVEGLQYGRGRLAHIMKGSPQGSGGLATWTLRARRGGLATCA